MQIEGPSFQPPPPPPPPPPKPEVKPAEGVRPRTPTMELDSSVAEDFGADFEDFDASGWEALPGFQVAPEITKAEAPPVRPMAGRHFSPDSEIALARLKERDTAQHGQARVERFYAEQDMEVPKDNWRIGDSQDVPKEAFLEAAREQGWKLKDGLSPEAAYAQFAGKGGNMTNAQFQQFFDAQVLPGIPNPAASGKEALMAIADDDAFVKAAFQAIVKRSPGENSDHLKNLKIMMERDGMSREQARMEVIKAFVNSDEAKIKTGAVNPAIGMPVRITVGGKEVPFLWQSQKHNDDRRLDAIPSHRGGALAVDQPLDFEAGIEAFLINFSNPLGGIAPTSPAAERLAAIGGMMGGSDFYWGYPHGNYPARTIDKFPELTPDIRLDPENRYNTFKGRPEMMKYLETRLEQVTTLSAQLDPALDGPAAIASAEQARLALQATVEFARRTKDGGQAVIVKREPGARVGWFADKDPSRPLDTSEATIPLDYVKKDHPRYAQIGQYYQLKGYEEALKDPNSAVNRQRDYWLK